MRRRLFMFALGAMFFYTGCDRPKNNDAFCDIIEKKNAPRIKEDDFVALAYTVKLDNGITLYSHYKHQLHRQSSDFKDDLFASLGKLGEGDSAVVKVSIDSMLAHDQLSKPNKLSGKYLHYFIRVNKVITRQGEPSRTSDSTLNADIEAFKHQFEQTDRQQEPAVLQQYIANSKVIFTKTASGLYYHIEKTGTGAKARSGDLAQVYFTGGFTNGEIFFTNDSLAAVDKGIYSPLRKYVPLEFYMGKALFIKGVEEGIVLLPEGSKATFVIPSALGDAGRYGYLPLVCHIEVIKVRHPKPGEAIKMLQEDDHGAEKQH